jgi:hypothetical protein
LFFVPVVFAGVHGWRARRSAAHDRGARGPMNAVPQEN